MLFAGDGSGNDNEGKKEMEKAQTQLR